MIEAIAEIIERLRNIREGEAKNDNIKTLSYELSDIFDEVKITENIYNIRWLEEFFQIRMVEIPENFCRRMNIIPPFHISGIRDTSEGRRSIFYYDNLGPAVITVALKLAETILCFREEVSKRSYNLPFEFELPLLFSTRLTMGEKIFFYNLICPCRKYIQMFEIYWVKRPDEFWELSDNGIWHKSMGYIKYMAGNLAIDFPTAVQVERFYHEILFEEINEIWKKVEK